MAFGFDINKVPTGSSPKVDIQPTGTQRAEKTEVPVTDNKVIGEYGDKLLEQVQPTFVQAAKISKTDAAELNEMFAMAGIKKPIMPTVVQYDRIANCDKASEEKIDNLTASNSIHDLFESEGFGKFNKLFNIV